jgi:hypothetical protein
VDYGKYNIELNSMTINKLLPQYFAVAGMNDYIYLHDRRMMQSMSSSNNIDIATDLKCVKRFSPRLDGFNRPNKHITACQFSDSNGYEVSCNNQTIHRQLIIIKNSLLGVGLLMQSTCLI